MNKVLKNIIKFILFIFMIFAILFLFLLAYLSVMEYRPEKVEILETNKNVEDVPSDISILTWNIGYGGLDSKNDFFMDGGTKIFARSKESVENNMNAISTFIKDINPTFTFLQEVDRPSKRSFFINEDKYLADELNQDRQFAYNYKVEFVPYPFPPMGNVESGLFTSSKYLPLESERLALYCPHKFPVRLVNLKRGLLLNRYPTKDGKELVLINLHLEAYDDGKGKKAQTDMLYGLMKDEYEKGNYVIAGGDWNQSFQEKNNFKQNGKYKYTPKPLKDTGLPDNFSFVYDPQCPTNRTNNRPYSPDDLKCIVNLVDGFAVSPNVKVKSVKTYSLDFENTDHNPVYLNLELN